MWILWDLFGFEDGLYLTILVYINLWSLPILSTLTFLTSSIVCVSIALFIIYSITDSCFCIGILYHVRKKFYFFACCSLHRMFLACRNSHSVALHWTLVLHHWVVHSRLKLLGLPWYLFCELSIIWSTVPCNLLKNTCSLFFPFWSQAQICVLNRFFLDLYLVLLVVFYY